MIRYYSAFGLTLLFYMIVSVGFFYGYPNPINSIKLNEEKVIALNHISLIQQEKVQETKKIQPIQKDVKQKRVESVLKEVQTKNQMVKQEKVVENKRAERATKKEVQTKKESQKPQEKMIKTAMKRDYKEEFIQEYLKTIMALIQKNIYYPKRAKLFNIQGEVIIEFTLTKEGLTKDYKTIQGHQLLQQSTIKAIEKASKLFPKVKEELRLKVPVVYKLT